MVLPPSQTSPGCRAVDSGQCRRCCETMRRWFPDVSPSPRRYAELPARAYSVTPVTGRLVTLWAAVCQAPLSMGFSWTEEWVAMPPIQGIISPHIRKLPHLPSKPGHPRQAGSVLRLPTPTVALISFTQLRGTQGYEPCPPPTIWWTPRQSRQTQSLELSSHRTRETALRTII